LKGGGGENRERTKTGASIFYAKAAIRHEINEKGGLSSGISRRGGESPVV